MGMYTEAYFRMHLRDDAPARLLLWLDMMANDSHVVDIQPYDGHEFFSLPRWTQVFYGAGAVYQISSSPVFRYRDEKRYRYYHELILSPSLKNYSNELESFVDWISPFVDGGPGTFLGFSLYETDYEPALYFAGEGVRYL